jgi:hypothetical protein
MAAVLGCGPKAVLSHASAAALWKIRPVGEGEIEVSVPVDVVRKRLGVVVHRRGNLASGDVARCCRIPLTSPICTLIDIARASVAISSRPRSTRPTSAD